MPAPGLTITATATSATTTTATTTTVTATTGPPVDCAGQYEDAGCYGGLRASVFATSTAPSGGGAACLDDVVVVSCPHVPVDLNWSYVVPRGEWASAARAAHAREIPSVVCPLGSTVAFRWSGTTHDVWRLPTEESYNLCDFGAAGASKAHDASAGSTFNFDCGLVGPHYFACSVEDACSRGSQKVRIYVSDPSKTVGLRARGGVSLEQFNTRYTNMFSGYFLNNQRPANLQLDEAIEAAQTVLARSPESCSDWIPESWNSNKSCRAFVYTDLGFMSRAGPAPDFPKSEAYYLQALEISPGLCGPTSYFAELRVQMDMRGEADEWYLKSCGACGQNGLDFHDLDRAYENRSWVPPPCPRTRFRQMLQFPNLTRFGDTAGLQSRMQDVVSAATRTRPSAWTVELASITLAVSYANVPGGVTTEQMNAAIAAANGVSTPAVSVVISRGRRLTNVTDPTVPSGPRRLASRVSGEITVDRASGADMVETANRIHARSQDTARLAGAIEEASGGSITVPPSSLTVSGVPVLRAAFETSVVVVAEGEVSAFTSSTVMSTVGASMGGSVTDMVAIVAAAVASTTGAAEEEAAPAARSSTLLRRGVPSGAPRSAGGAWPTVALVLVLRAR